MNDHEDETMTKQYRCEIESFRFSWTRYLAHSPRIHSDKSKGSFEISKCVNSYAAVPKRWPQFRYGIAFKTYLTSRLMDVSAVSPGVHCL